MLVKALCLLILLLSGSWAGKKSSQKFDKEERLAAKLSKCQACQTLVGSFNKGMERTSRGKFEGGDAAWEEKNQMSGYLNSEVRFVEIQEELCKDVPRGELQCHDNHHHWEEHLEEWWALGDLRSPLHQWLCIDKLEACCPENHFGPECQPCLIQDASGKFCSGHGKCNGGGTRTGNGKCQCDKGYKGWECGQCSGGFYKVDGESKTFECQACHKGCKETCSGPGSKSCDACKSGYQMDDQEGCVDIDECHVTKPCGVNKYCVNIDGSYKCHKCHKSCKGCKEGGGASDCLECAQGYNKIEKEEGIFSCLLDKEAGNYLNVKRNRYLTYAGLALVSAISFRQSYKIAGALVAVSIGFVAVSEYFLKDIINLRMI